MLAVAGGMIITMAGRVIDRGTLLVDKGKIFGIEQGMVIPRGADSVDATGKVVMPGMIDAHSHLGIVEEIYREEGDDCNESTDPVTPHLRAIDAVNPADLGFRDALAGGVTTVVTGPGSANIIGGEMAAVKTYGTVIDDMIVRFPAGLKAALGENPKRSYGREKKTPATRMASAAILREALARGQEYLKKSAAGGAGNAAAVEKDLKMEALARVLKREIPLRVHAHRADDIMTAVRIAREFQVELVVEHCTEGHIVARKLAELGVPAVIGPVITNRAKVEMQGLTLQTARVLSEAGVLFAIMTDHPVVPIQFLAISAAMTVKGGLTVDAALRAVTINAAKILKLDHRLGSLEPGKDADFIVLDRHPFDFLCRVEKVFINGVKVYSIV
ncbi:amidohydrolase [Pelotomaculum sp. PtaB.Bin117]|uniref:amidohydrolase n=1 Tax=Pelotomaculum sp. PtaB.Bin117 TaxID=1811694 RepID=UPI0009D0828A|nr:amidohydrolase [Pelotomaculum sp. PtaB.Bin117]OPX91439.1 MAG: N-substituted formamide deformylase precursor [Pelotomaculum sp. PtaB.Bin117]OPY62975.1 MAG: N-substituted formamide deformylase precursor [Pelotomaculum sp. PtaU1.Bin065]